MSVFTSVSEPELSAWLRGYDIGDLVALVGIASGIENTNYFVTTTRAEYVLTLFEKLNAAEIPFFLNLMAHLAEHGTPAPHPLAAKNGNYLGELCGKPACLVTRLRGASVLHPEPHHCAALGTLLATMHVGAQSFGDTIANPRGPKWWKTTAPIVAPKLDAAAAQLLKDELVFQALFRSEDLPRSVIHADLFRDNVLFEANRLSGVIDFYYACEDACLYDVAIAANDWCAYADGNLDQARVMSMLNAYHEIRPLTAIERGAWPVMLRAAALRFWLSRLHDLHFPRPGEITHAKNPDEFRRILESHVRNQWRLQRLWVGG